MATENKSLKYFMRPVQQEIITFTGPEAFKDDDGNPINFEAKILTQQEITQINANYRRRSVATDKKGNPVTPLYPPLYQPLNQGSLTITQGR